MYIHNSPNYLSLKDSKKQLMAFQKLLPFLFIIALSSCRTFESTKMFSTQKEFQYLDPPAAPSQTVIQPNDVLSITMQSNNGSAMLDASMAVGGIGNNSSQLQQQLNGRRSTFEYLVEKDSLVKIPTLGRIKLGGLTVREAEDFLEEMFGENYVEPYVRIDITNKKVFLFLEQATSASVLNLPKEDISLVEALAQIGGLSKYSKSYQIRLLRGAKENVQVYNFNFYSLESFKSADITLYANDIVYIETRPRYIVKAIDEVQPYLLLITTALLAYNTFKSL